MISNSIFLTRDSFHFSRYCAVPTFICLLQQDESKITLGPFFFIFSRYSSEYSIFCHWIGKSVSMRGALRTRRSFEKIPVSRCFGLKLPHSHGMGRTWSYFQEPTYWLMCTNGCGRRHSFCLHSWGGPCYKLWGSTGWLKSSPGCGLLDVAVSLAKSSRWPALLLLSSLWGCWRCALIVFPGIRRHCKLVH